MTGIERVHQSLFLHDVLFINANTPLERLLKLFRDS